MSDKILKSLFLFSLLAVFFVWGFVSHWKEVFPFQVLREARIAYRAMIELFQGRNIEIPRGVDFWDNSGMTEPVIRQLSKDAGRENIFILGNERAHLNLCQKAGCLAWILDRSGSILHAWKNIPDLWVPLENRDAVKNTWRAYPVGAYLYPNGDILVSYQGEDVFPVFMGLAKFDKSSNLIWKRNDFHHHWFSVDGDGKIYIGGAEVVETPFYVKKHKKFFSCEKGRFHYEPIVILDQDGLEIDKIDTFNALIESDLAGVFHNNGKDHYQIETCDPMHLNDVRILTEEMAAKFPRFRPGDLLVSFRSLNGVGVLDPDTERFKWFHVGGFQSQHSPRFQAANTVLVFDNLGGIESLGLSRIVGINVITNQAKTVFPRPGVDIPSRSFFSETAGHIDVHPDHQRLLVSWTHQGLVWEIDIESGEVLWETVNTHIVDDRPARVSVYTSLYVPDLSFPMNGGRIIP